jgi:hypothetical protein
MTAVLLDRLGNERRHRGALAPVDGLARRSDEAIWQADGNLSGHTVSIPRGRGIAATSVYRATCRAAPPSRLRAHG